MTNFQSDFGGGKRFFDIFLLSDSGYGGVPFLRRIAQSKGGFKRLLLSYSEHATDAGNYPNEHGQVGRISENHGSSKKNIVFFRKIQNFPDFENYFENYF